MEQERRRSLDLVQSLDRLDVLHLVVDASMPGWPLLYASTPCGKLTGEGGCSVRVCLALAVAGTQQLIPCCKRAMGMSNPLAWFVAACCLGQQETKASREVCQLCAVIDVGMLCLPSPS